MSEVSDVNTALTTNVFDRISANKNIKREPIKVLTDGLTIVKKINLNRNDKCYCGSGLKLKNCHLTSVENGYNKIVRK
jgi:uncharacterized protein YecA (UPF0149 family)